MREGIRGFVNHLRRPDKTGEAFLVRTHLASVPSYLMERVAAQPDWSSLTPGLDQALGAWAAEEGPATPIQVVVGAPYSGVPVGLAAWAKALGWRLAVAPAEEGKPYEKQ